MQGLSYRGGVLMLAAAMLLSACAALPPQGAQPPVPAQVVETPKLPPAVPVDTPPETPVENTPKPDSYTVKPGDTLIRIGLDTGQSPTDIARWNGLTDPGKIVAGQVLRLVPRLRHSSKLEP